MGDLTDTETGEITTRSALLPAVVEQTAVPAMTLPEMAHALDVAEHFKREILRPGVDFGTIPGVKKPSLWKPGAERAMQLFGLGHRCDRVEIERDANGERLGITYRCEVFKSLPDGREVMLSTCEGYAGYDESRFWDRVYEGEKGNRRPKKNPDGSIHMEKSPWNAVLKMADKRAFVGAVLKATGLSDFFTQDVEDFEDRVSPHQPRQPEPAGPITLRPETLAKITEALERDKVPAADLAEMVLTVTGGRTMMLAEVYEGAEFVALRAAWREYLARASDATPAEPEAEPHRERCPATAVIQHSRHDCVLEAGHEGDHDNGHGAAWNGKSDLPDVVEGLGRERVQQIRDRVGPHPDTRPCTPPQRTNVNVICTKLGHKKQEDRLRALSAWLGRPIESSNDLAFSEASAIIEACKA